MEQLPPTRLEELRYMERYKMRPHEEPIFRLPPRESLRDDMLVTG